MKYILMNKNTEVLEFTYDEDEYNITSIDKIITEINKRIEKIKELQEKLKMN